MVESIDLVDEIEVGDRTLTLRGRHTRWSWSVGPVGMAWSYVRPIEAIEHDPGGDDVRHRIPDVGLMLRVLAVVAVMMMLRGRRRR